MLESSLIESRSANHTKKPVTVTVSIALHVAVLSVLLLIPLIYTSALPLTNLTTQMVVPAPIEQEIIDLIPHPAAPVIFKISQVDPHDLVAPTAIPREIAMVTDPPMQSGFTPTPAAGQINSILQAALMNEPVPVAPTPPLPPPPPPIPAHADPIRIGGTVQQANLIRQVKPVYPPLALKTRVEGLVVLEAMISKEGSVDNLRVVSGHPLLIQAAIGAVSQWQYRPTLLNGEPVEVVTTVTVTFRLSQ